MSDNELHDVLKAELEPKFQSYFNQGLMTGWDACIYEIDKLTSGLTSAKAIREVIKRKAAEANSRGKKNGWCVAASGMCVAMAWLNAI